MFVRRYNMRRRKWRYKNLQNFNDIISVLRSKMHLQFVKVEGHAFLIGVDE